MTFTPITGKAESKAAFVRLEAALMNGAKSISHVVGYPSGHAVCIVRWLPKYAFWSVLQTIENRFWCAYGAEDPFTTSKSLNITCEINPPLSGKNGRCAGVFLRDSAGEVYLAHTGRVGGGKQGVGKAAFLDFYTGDLNEIEWPDGQVSEVIVIGRIGSKGFVRNLAHYVRTVNAFKATVDGDQQPTTNQPDLTFAPEFHGKKKYAVSHAIECESNHGTVVDALRSQLTKKGLKPYNNKRIDLFLVKGKATPSHIFEVKTDCLSGSIYQAVGQVMIHGAVHQSHPKRILVLPEHPDSNTKRRLDRIDIDVLTYTLNDGHVAFGNLNAVL